MFTPRFPSLRGASRRAYSRAVQWRKLSSALEVSNKTVPSQVSLKGWTPVTSEPLERPLLPPQLPLGDRYPNLRYEERIIKDRDPPISISIYHPDPISRSSSRKILYLPSPNTTFFPPPEKVISLLSEITSATVIVPTPTTTISLFPQPLHNLLRIYDHFNSDPSNITPTAILATGIAAPLATAIGVTEESVTALGVWGGIFDLTIHAEEATSWNRELEQWDHFSPPPSSPMAEEVPRLGMTMEEFITLRRQYFPNPETWADPFASPHLFFRSALVEFSRLCLREIMGDQVEGKGTGAYQKKFKQIHEEEQESYIFPRRQKRNLQNYPEWFRDAPFPKVRIVIPAVEEGKDDVTTKQGTLFKEAARACLAQWISGKGHQGEDARIEADAAVSTDILAAGEGWESEVAAMGHWLNWVFDEAQTST